MFGIIRSVARYPARQILKASVPSRNYLIVWDPVAYKYPDLVLPTDPARADEEDDEYENLSGELSSAEYDEYIRQFEAEIDQLKEYQYPGWKLYQLKPKQVRRIRKNMREGRIARSKVNAVLDLINYRKSYTKGPK